MIFKEADLKKVIGNVFKIDPKRVGEDASIDTIGSWDSLAHLNLVLALEDRFNIMLTEDEAVEILNYKIIKIVLKNHDIEFKD